MPELLKETIEVGLYRIELDEEGVTIYDHADDEGNELPAGEDAVFVDMTPKTRREGNQLSMALRKASKRLEELARGLPE